MPENGALTTSDQWHALVAQYGPTGGERVRVHRVHQRSEVEWGMATVSVAGLERPPGAAPLTMTLLDISSGGVMLRSFEPLKRGIGVGLAIALGDDEALLRGYVMHCTPMLGGHKVGVQLLFGDEAGIQ